MQSVNTNIALRVNANPRAWLLRFFAAVLVCLLLPAAGAQDWKTELKTEQAKNTSRISAIEVEAAPVVTLLRENTKAVAAHNAQHPDGTCTYPDGHPEVCAPWIDEAAKLNTVRLKLVSRLQPLSDESDRLIERNKEIVRRLRCVTLPNACKSDADCNECSSCGTFDGRGTQGVCHPRP